jgi:hypothetical protein
MTTAAASAADDDAKKFPTATPIKHLVVIFQENVSFDHYFGTYPVAKNTDGTPFTASSDTPTVNNLSTPLDVNKGFAPLKGVDLLNNNPNSISSNPADGPPTNGSDASNPFRLSPAQALTVDQGHNYKPEQQASDGGKMDGFPAFTGAAGGNFNGNKPPDPPPAAVGTKGLVMGYYDGNTVTAMWNYAQNYALNDNSYTTTYGPSTPGALNLIAGQTSGFTAYNGVVDSSGKLLHPTHEVQDKNPPVAPPGGNFTEIGDGDPLNDVCSNTTVTNGVPFDNIQMAGKNIGDLLNAQGITWGSFEGGFNLSITNPNGTTGCKRSSPPTVPVPPNFIPTSESTDYIPHHEPFQYFASTPFGRSCDCDCGARFCRRSPRI